ncbi:VanZ family protein [Bifidobacterium sp. BRDM6]|uniref:VanZ family protein n=2 Tax=Bifidobacterium choloepi TaxID=2614131 RepID=A0A6I5N829_9BIFI|nr:VanZ family protein [Bifidobacterium choloepi]NEG69991.1 VanZ family protein [Bifidobacterium choloepi]
MLWPVVSAVLTLPILAFIYHRNHLLTWGSAITSYVAVLYALGLLTFTQFPAPSDPTKFCATHHYGPQLDLFAFVPQLLHGGLTDQLQLLMNVVFFLPMGFMLCRWAKWKWYVAIPFAFCCSAFIETTQLTGVWGLYPCAFRHFDVDDMLTNTTGAILGYIVGAIYTHFVPQKVDVTPGLVTKPGFVHRMVSMAIDFLCAFLVYFVVSLAFIHLFYKVATPLADGTFYLVQWTVDTNLLQLGVWAIALVSFLIFELWIPATHDGRTLGAMYTHMTVETKVRRGWARVGFYFLRTVVLGALFLLMVTWDARFWIVLGALLVLWIFTRRMPWDFIPGQRRNA